MIQLIDTHAHIYAKDFRKDIDDVLRVASEEGVYKIYMPNVDSETIDPMLEMEQKYPAQCVPMMGLHPCHVKKDFEKELYQVETWLAKRPFVTVGEIGLDFYWDMTFREQQEEALRIQLRWAKQYNIPVAIHCRNSFAETADIIEAEQDGTLTGVFHCFSGNADDAKRAAALGFVVGIGGVATFKNGGVAEAVPDIDLSQIVLETDCPYLAPVPHRGKRNEPSYIALIAQKLADIKAIPLEELAKITTANALKLFKQTA
ncbi:TatD DNase family protein [Flexibacter flexilis DSM 6793]|uniref:TatD DNase family protein n=1 Tax=Flexibacter flexilis DSM 6793 TaxID=927664 RepID=A0A1I1N4C3_9BACT|nr:TatD family hydrolase [Flexibacter flexilis]SFC92042.1 TatD DNase family protein [Flexibacter flexilis DSM 6793]